MFFAHNRHGAHEVEGQQRIVKVGGVANLSEGLTLIVTEGMFKTLLLAVFDPAGYVSSTSIFPVKLALSFSFLRVLRVLGSEGTNSLTPSQSVVGTPFCEIWHVWLTLDESGRCVTPDAVVSGSGRGGVAVMSR